MAVKPDYSEALNNRGNALASLDRYEEAIGSYDRALAIRPEYAEALNNRGVALGRLNRFQEAVECCDKAVTVKPDYSEGYSNRGLFLQYLNRGSEALADYARAITLAPENADAHYYRGMACLRAGDFATGWREYEWRWQSEQMRPHRRVFSQPLWNGQQSLVGKTILLYAEQGLGDSIMAARYIPDVVALGAKAIVEVPAPLKSIFLQLSGVSRIFVKGEALPDFDLRCPLMSLPMAFGTALETIPADVPYLAASEDRIAAWKKKLGDTKITRIGIVWSGNQRHANDRNRSIAFEKFCGLRSPDYQLVSLQKELRIGDKEILEKYPDILHFEDQIKDFTDTAALISQLDFVVSIDTSVAHLAGAMGKPVWILLPSFSDWRWLPGREDNPWYPTARLFWQSSGEDWTKVIDRVKGELGSWHGVGKGSNRSSTSDRGPDRLNVQRTLQQAIAFHQQGKLTQAETACEQILESVPEQFDALHLLGRIRAQQGRGEEALTLLTSALKEYPNSVEALVAKGIALASLGRHEQAFACYDEALAIKPDHSEAHYNRGVLLQRLNRHDEAIISFDRALAIRPDYAIALNNRGLCLQGLGRHEQAIASFDQALTITPNFAEALNNRGNSLGILDRRHEAIASYEKALTAKPDLIEALNNLGCSLLSVERYEEALVVFDRALAIKPDYANLLYNKGLTLAKLGRHDDAIATFNGALAINPRYVEAITGLATSLNATGRHHEGIASYDRALAIKADEVPALVNRGVALGDINRHEEAIASYDRALAFNPDHTVALNNRGTALEKLLRFKEAVVSYSRAAEIDPQFTAVLLNCGSALRKLNRHTEAIAYYEKSRLLDSTYQYALGMYADCVLATCDWNKTSRLAGELLTHVKEDKSAISPFTFMSYCTDPLLQLKCAQSYVRAKYPLSHRPLWDGKKYRHDKMRIAYISSDFRSHPVAYLMIGLIERHDRERFEIIGISIGADDRSEIRARLIKSFDHFHNVSGKGDEEIARLLRDMEVDIAVDLNGHTENSRLGILARRPAPLQVSYIGYAGTTGAPFIDYLIADPIALPFDQGEAYAEKIVQLPDSYLVYDSKQKISDQVPTRVDAKLPSEGFVFCCFNQCYKIAPPVFDIWMRLLGAIEGSVLWLSRPNEPALANLQREAEARGIDPRRLVFAPRVERLEDHLARHRLADLFLDTLPYNAHSTASDALWAGLPVLTCKGQTFAGRVGTSLLHAVGLPELVTDSPDAYEALAKRLAQDPTLLGSFRRRLGQNRSTSLLFDTDRLRRHIESAFVTMWERQQRDERPQSFRVDPIEVGPKVINARDEALAAIGNAATNYQQARSEISAELMTSALRQNPQPPKELFHRGVALAKQRRHDEALECYDKVLKIKPNFAEALRGRANALRNLNRSNEAIVSYDQALAIKPTYPEALNGRGLALASLNQFDEAIVSYNRALAIKPDFPEALHNRGIALGELKLLEQAIASFDQALAIRPDYVAALSNRGVALRKLNRLDEAIASYARAVAIKPDHSRALSSLADCAMAVCDWPSVARLTPELADRVGKQSLSIEPITFLGISDNAEMQLACARNFVRSKIPHTLKPLWEGEAYRHQTLKVAYLSADFRRHPVTSLISQLIELHDRKRFEVIGISYGVDDGSAARSRLVKAFDQFHDVRVRSDRDIAGLIRDLEVDIAVDLTGHTGNSRPRILAYRPAPVQVSYLGYPGTLGADFIDYVLADKHVVPLDQQQFFDERIIHLPNCYQVSDSNRRISSDHISRQEAGLPDHGFVFCCFNQSFKITAPIFDVWMRLLKAIEGSVLWLSQANDLTKRNLASEAAARGIDPSRLIFAPKLANLEDHLARHRLADLFLDTRPFNAHTTANDALWAGLPVLTCAGRTFAGRVGTSLLHAVGLPELVTTNLATYEASALTLATDPALLQSIRKKLEEHRRTFSLFDTDQFRLHIEAAYLRMRELQREGKRLQSFSVELIKNPEVREVPARVPEVPRADQIAIESPALQKVMTLYRQGKLSEAEVMCEQLLKTQPDSFDILHILGVIKTQQGRYEESLELINAVLQANPISIEALLNKGIALANLKRYDEAINCYEQALGIDPNNFTILNARGAALAKLDRHGEAISSFERALAINRNYAEAHFNRGVTLGNIGRYDEAIASYDLALAIKPNYAEALNNRGNALTSLDRRHEAIAGYDAALSIKPGYAEALNNRGTALQGLNRQSEALQSYSQALEIKPDYPDAHYNRGNTLAALDRFGEALANFDRALAIRPDYAEAFNNRGALLQAMNHHEEAIVDYGRALAIKPNYADAHYNRGMAYLLTGDFFRGWPECEWRWAGTHLGAHKRNFAKPEWTGGESLAGKTILVHAEQGFGDTIMIARYASKVAACGAKVILEVPSELNALVAKMPGVFQVASTGNRLPAFDLHCPIMSLPLAFGTTLATIPSDFPYLTAPADRVATWRERLRDVPYPRVGIAWSGNPRLKNDRNRSIPLQDLRAILSPDFAMVSLQKDVRPGDEEALQRHPQIFNIDGALRDFADTAALISQLDLVISVDTAVAHLAGAMGKATWILLPNVPDWRWLLDREDSPWYPSARLFRQPAIGDWTSVIARVKNELASWLADRKHERPEMLKQSQKRPDLRQTLKRAAALYDKGKLPEAEELYRKILKVSPDQFEALHYLGAIHLRQKKYQDSVRFITRAVEKNKRSAEAYSNLGLALLELGQAAQAIDSLDKALAIKPGFAQAHHNRGLALANLGHHQQALVAYDKALTSKPDYPEALLNRAVTLNKLDRCDEALQSYDKALVVKPDWAHAHYNRGALLAHLNRYAEAIKSYDQALALDPSHVDARLNRGFEYLRSGDYVRGLAGYESRWERQDVKVQKRSFGPALWHGKESLSGKTLLVHAEQGFGDTFMAARYVPMLAEKGARVLLEVQRPLKSLLAQVEGAAEIVAKGEALRDYDMHCPVMSLPLAFGTTLTTISANVPYIAAPEERISAWEKRLKGVPFPRVGIVWSGNQVPNPKRSISFEDIRAIFSSDCQFVSLQKELLPADLEAVRAQTGLVEFGDQINDFADTAALISLMDLVISIDTSVANLAGAMGKPVWILLPFHSDWRWLRDREDSPWYPTARLFRQPAMDDWVSVIGRVRNELSSWRAKYRPVVSDI